MREDWVEICLGDIAIIYNGNSINENLKNNKYKTCNAGFNYIGTKDVGFDGNIEYENGVKIPFNEPKFKIAPKGCVLVCSEGGSAGKKTGFVTEDICFGNKLYAIINEYSAFEGRYIYHYTRYRRFFELFQEQMNGIIGGVSAKKFSNITIPLSPLPIQRAIVQKIENLFASLDKGIAELKTAQEQLKVYRQAVLKKAFEGKLVSNHDSKDSPENLDLKNDGKENHGHQGNQNNQGSDNLPKGWKWVTFNDVCLKIGDIDHKMPKQVESGGFPYISTKDFTDDLKISFEKAKYISEEDFQNLARKIKPEKGDIIFPRYGTIGKNIFVDFEKDFLVSYSCAVIKPNHNKVDSKYLFYFSLSPVIKDEIKKYVVETTQANIGIASIKRFVFPLPNDKSEQHAIVREIESRLSVCNKVEQSIAEALEKAEALRQSILKKAFEGRLLSEAEVTACKQEADYEPASVLLERIKKEKKNGK